MAPNLISLPESGFAAVYSTPSKTLKITAKGKIPGFWSKPEILRERWNGGLKYSLRGFPLGLGKQPDQELDVFLDEIITLPVRSFNNDSVLVETGGGTWTIKILYDVPVAPPEKNPASTIVLPPIKKFLPLGEVLHISAAIPAGRQSSVNVKFNDELIRLTGANARDDQIVWAFKWAKKPDDKSNPQLIEVHSDQWNGQPPPESKTIRTVQGYIVQFVLLG